jgi:hypothetical protein
MRLRFHTPDRTVNSRSKLLRTYDRKRASRAIPSPVGSLAPRPGRAQPAGRPAQGHSALTPRVTRPEELDDILAKTLSLSEAEQLQVADMLRHSSLGQIVGAAAEVAQRLDLISTLRHVIYSPDVSSKMREVDQLHPLVKDQAWLFGEDWRLSRSESSLTNVLRAVVDNDVLLEADLSSPESELQAKDRRRRVDLLLERTILSPGDQQRLVVELKRPSVSLNNKELGRSVPTQAS